MNVHHKDNQPVESSIEKSVSLTTNDQNSIPPTQIVKTVLGFMPAEIKRAEAELKLTVEQLLKLESCKGYVETPIQALDGIYVHQA